MNKGYLAGIAAAAAAAVVLLVLSAESDLLDADPPAPVSSEVMLPGDPAPKDPGTNLLEKLAQPDDPFPDPFTYDPEAAAECERAGGSYFLAEIYVCQMPVGDEGKECTDSSQCEDICSPDPDLYSYDEDLEGRSDIQGRCTVFSHGCDRVLVDERVQWMCG